MWKLYLLYMYQNISRFVAGLKCWDHRASQRRCELSSSSLLWSRPLPVDVILIWLHPPPQPRNRLRVQVFVRVPFFWGDCVVRLGSGAWWIVLKGVKLLKSYRVKSPGMEEHDGGLSPPSISSLSVLDYILKGFLHFRALNLLYSYCLFGSNRTCRLILNIQTGSAWASIVVRSHIPSSEWTVWVFLR